MQLQVQETLAAVAFETPIKFNIQEVPEAVMEAPGEDAEPGRGLVSVSRRGERRPQRNTSLLYIDIDICHPLFSFLSSLL